VTTKALLGVVKRPKISNAKKNFVTPEIGKKLEKMKMSIFGKNRLFEKSIKNS
jgi:hypothetical protein